MRRIRHISFLSIFLLARIVCADISAQLSEATAPLAAGVPEIAVVRLQSLLDKDLSEQEWRVAAVKLGEALVAARQPANAVKLLANARLRDVPAAKFWRAQGLADLGRWSEALPLYEQLAVDDHLPFAKDAAFGAAEMLCALGRQDEALQKLAPLLRDQEWGIPARLRSAELYIDKGAAPEAKRLLDQTHPKTAAQRKQRHLLRARSELVSGKIEKAIALFESLLRKPEGASHDVLLAALFGVADAELKRKTAEDGADIMEDYIDHHPQDADLARIFAKLDELYRAERKPPRAELERWTRDPAQPRRSLARWHLASFELRAGHRDRAREYFSDLQRDGAKFFPNSYAVAMLEFAKLELEDRQFDQALAILNDARAAKPDSVLLDRIDLLAGRTNYLAGRFDQSTNQYKKLARSDSPFSRLAFFNAAAGWLQLDRHDQFLTDYKEFEKQGGDEGSRAELRLEEALVQAAKADPRAAESLHAFVHDFPDNPRISEAFVALAELAFHSSPPHLDEARKYLTRAAEAKPTLAAAERADYLRIWIEDATESNDDDAKVVELANRFLKQHAASSFAPDVRMKLAETYYLRQDFPNAQTQFELLAQENPTGPLAEKALFFAAESAVSSMASGALDHAITLFDQVVRMNGDLKWAARNEQAAIERKLGKSHDALSLYDEVLKSDARPAEKREALCAKGDIFFETGGADYQRAIDAYDQLASDKDLPAHWRNQALFKKALCLEKKADRTGALETFYRVLEDEARPDRQHELFWYYKAGFNAARILEEDSKWESAAAVYERLANAGGSRSEEARARLTRLRLEHFLWAN